MCACVCVRGHVCVLVWKGAPGITMHSRRTSRRGSNKLSRRHARPRTPRACAGCSPLRYSTPCAPRTSVRADPMAWEPPPRHRQGGGGSDVCVLHVCVTHVCVCVCVFVCVACVCCMCVACVCVRVFVCVVCSAGWQGFPRSLSQIEVGYSSESFSTSAVTM